MRLILFLLAHVPVIAVPQVQNVPGHRCWSPCNICEGHCNNDAECASGLVCWKRIGGRSVPGCELGADVYPNRAYCIRDDECPPDANGNAVGRTLGCGNKLSRIASAHNTHVVPSLVDVGQSGGACSSSSICNLCEGNCHSDAECASGLVCWKRMAQRHVPGCAIGGSGDIGGYWYCTHPCPDDADGNPVKYSWGCENKLSTVLTSSNSANCGISDGTLDIWVNSAIATNEIYAFSTSTDFVVSGQVSASGADIQGALAAQSLTTKIITSDNIVDNAIKSIHIEDGQVATGEIADDAIISAKIAISAVNSLHIQSDAILTRHIGDGQITSNKLNPNLQIGSIYLTGSGQDQKIITPKLVVSQDLTVTGETTLNDKITGHSLVLTNVVSSTPYTPAAYTNPASVIANGFIGGATIQKSLDATKYVHAQGFSVNSDRRIKKNIVPVPDNYALDIIRKLDAKYYSYIDQRARGTDKTIGFIAQEVQELLPIAASKTTDAIPNKLRLVTPVWTHKSDGLYNMHLPDRVEPGVYKFYVSSDGRTEEGIVLKTTDGTTFVTTQKYTKVFLYGQQVDDFVMIDKDKIFSVSYAALQQVDKNQISLTERITQLENTIKQLDDRILKLEV